MSESTTPAGLAVGLTCPECGHARSRVLYTRTRGGRIVRRRACHGCGARFTTWEHIVSHTEVSAPPPPDGVTSIIHY